MWFFGKKALNPEQLPIGEAWSVSQGDHDGKPMIVRFHSGYGKFKGVEGYEHQVGIAVPLNAPEPSGLPSSAENRELDSVEDALCAALESGRESLLVAIITTSGMREFVFYTLAPEQVKAKFEQLRKNINSHKIQLMIQPDKEWDVFARLS